MLKVGVRPSSACGVSHFLADEALPNFAPDRGGKSSARHTLIPPPVALAQLLAGLCCWCLAVLVPHNLVVRLPSARLKHALGPAVRRVRFRRRHRMLAQLLRQAPTQARTIQIFKVLGGRRLGGGRVLERLLLRQVVIVFQSGGGGGRLGRDFGGARNGRGERAFLRRASCLSKSQKSSLCMLPRTTSRRAGIEFTCAKIWLCCCNARLQALQAKCEAIGALIEAYWKEEQFGEERE